MDEDVKNVLVNIHHRASQRRSTMQATRTSKLDASSISKAKEPPKSQASPTKQREKVKMQDDVKEVLKYIKEEDVAPQSPGTLSPNANTCSSIKYKEEFIKLVEFQNKVKYKPVMEQQILHLKALKSLHDYFKENKSKYKGDALLEASKPFIPPLSPSAAILNSPQQQQRPKSSHDQIKAHMKARPQSSLGETSRPRWH